MSWAEHLLKTLNGVPQTKKEILNPLLVEHPLLLKKLASALSKATSTDYFKIITNDDLDIVRNILLFAREARSAFQVKETMQVVPYSTCNPVSRDLIVLSGVNTPTDVLVKRKKIRLITSAPHKDIITIHTKKKKKECLESPQ